MEKTAVEWLEWLYKEGILNQKSFEIAKQKENEQLLSVYKSGLAGFMEDGIQKITITRIND
jgi:hypothetical protein